MANAINSVNYNNNTYVFTTPYGSCSTAAGTAAKTVSVDNFSLETGARVTVKFTVTNTAGSPTLNVNSTGAKAIYYNGAAITAGYLKANKVYEFIYNGNQWDFVGDIDTDTNTNTKVTAVGNHYTPAKSKTISASSTTAATWGSTDMVTGIEMDAAGHVTGVTSIQMPANPNTDTNTTYSLSKDGSSIILTGSDGSTTSVTDADTNTNTSHSHSAGIGLTGSGSAGTGSGTYTYKAKLRSETALTVDSAAATTTSGRVYPVAVDKTGYLAVNVPWTNTTYSAATQSAAGLMSADDKAKLDGIDKGANDYALPNATSSTLGGVKVGSNITVSSGTISLTKANVTAALGYTPPTSDTNTDTKVTNTASTSTKFYITGTSSSSTNTGTQYFDTGVYVDTTAGALKATTFNGYTLAAACAKGVDTTATSGSANLITSGAMYTALAGKAASSHTHSYLPLSGGTVSGGITANSFTTGGAISANSVNVSSTITCNGELHAKCGIEIFHATPYIDFHFNDTTTDYTSRIIESASGVLNINGVYFNANNPILKNATSLSAYDADGVRKTLIWLSTDDGIVIGTSSRDATNAHSGNTLLSAPNGNVKIMNSENTLIYNMSSGVGYFRPTTNADDCLGGSSYRWSTIFAKNALNTSSDYYQKRDIESMPQKYIDMLDDIDPVIFKFNDGDRVHSGYISQWIEESMKKYDITAEEFGGFCKDPKLDEDENVIEGEYEYSLRYSEFIPILHAKMKQLESGYNERLEELNNKIAELEAKLNIE